MTEAAAIVDVLVVGEAIVDIIRTDAGNVETPGGSPANVALGLGRLGHDVALLTGLGRDDRGAMIARHLAESSVTVLPESFSLPHTSTAAATIAADGSATYEFDVEWSLPAAAPAVRPRILHVGSVAAFLQPGAGRVREIVETTSAQEITFDPNIRPALLGAHSEVLPAFESLASLATVVKLSDEDAGWLYPGMKPASVVAHVRALGPRFAAVTLGADGSLVSAGTDVVEIPAAQVTVVDTIGAGDTYMASLIASLLDLPPGPILPEQAAAIGNRAARAAGITASRAGADLPTRADLDAV